MGLDAQRFRSCSARLQVSRSDMPKIKSISFTSPYDAEEAEIERRRALAQALQQQSAQPLPTNRMAGRIAVPIHPLEGAAQLAQGAAGAYQERQAGEQRRDLYKRMASERSNTLAQALRAGMGTPGSSETIMDETAAGGMGQMAQINAPAVPGNPQAAYGILAGSQDPMLQQLGMQGALSSMPKLQEPFTLSPGAVRYDAQGKPIASAPHKPEKPQAQSNLARLMAERAALPPGDPRTAAYDNAIRKESETAKQINPTIVMPKPEKVPLGYRSTPEGNLEAIPGGPADTKLQGVLNQDTAALQTSANALDRLALAANEVMNHRGLERTTGLMGALPNIPGSAASDAEAKLEQLKSQAGFAVLQAMRDASKTGGALGQVSNFEVQQLQNNLAALQKAQSPEQIKQELAKLISYAEGAKTRLQNAYNLKHAGKTPQTGNSKLTPAEQKELEELRKRFGR